MNNTNYKEINELILAATALKHAFMKAGLYKTYHKMDEVTKQIGWEASEIIDNKHPTKLKSRRKEKFTKMSKENKIKKRYIDYPPNVPKRLFKILKYWDFRRWFVAKALGVNAGYLSQLLNKGIEPTDTTTKGRDVRKRLFLPVRKHKNFNQIVIHKPKTDQPEFIKEWKHLPTEERHKVIQEYLEWKKKQKQNSS